MTDAILIFTFSPIQSFIGEARRAADLYAGSKILSRLANAAVSQIRQEAGIESVIYPISESAEDTPNVLVAQVPSAQVATIAQNAKTKLLSEWKSIANSAREGMKKRGLESDDRWDEIWESQTRDDFYWQVFWAAAEMESPDGYIAAYEKASDALDAVKRSRTFGQFLEYGFKDSLSGQREALHTANLDGKEYWKKVAASRQISSAELRPSGAERLDALGAIKRFSKMAEEQSFPSVSTVASAPFVRACSDAGILAPFSSALQQFNAQVGKEYFYRVKEFARGFEFDGDLVYRETYAPERLEASYGKPPQQPREVVAALETLYGEANKNKVHPSAPSPYYALLVMDGDGMGEHIRACKDQTQHRDLSQRLANFTKRTREEIVLPPKGFLIYAGGDDVLALVPLQYVMDIAQKLQEAYREAFEGWLEEALPVRDGNHMPFTISAGIAIAHHLYPLDAALTQARHAEKQIAKRVPNKAALGVSVLKRSGETVHVRSRWGSMNTLFDEMVEHFANERLASRFAYELYERARVVTGLEDARAAAIRQLINRHKSKELSDPKDLTVRLARWAQELDSQMPPDEEQACDQKSQDDKKEPSPQGLVELGRWMILARFVAQGGRE
mgnify:CR=1 FL=1